MADQASELLREGGHSTHGGKRARETKMRTQTLTILPFTIIIPSKSVSYTVLATFSRLQDPKIFRILPFCQTETISRQLINASKYMYIENVMSPKIQLKLHLKLALLDS